MKNSKEKLLVAITILTISMTSAAAMDDKKDMKDLTGNASINLRVTQQFMLTFIAGAAGLVNLAVLAKSQSIGSAASMAKQ